MFPAAVGSLHRAASDWFEREGWVIDAIRHAQAARDWPHAARLLLDNRDRPDPRRASGHRSRAVGCIPGAREQPTIQSSRSRLPAVRLRDGSFDEADAYIASAERHAEEVPEDRKRLFELHRGQRQARRRRATRRSATARCRRCNRSRRRFQAQRPTSHTDEIRCVGADDARHHRAVVAAIGRRAPPPRGRTRAGAADRAAVSGDRLPRPPGDRRPAQRAVGLGRA